MTDKIDITLTINGRTHTATVEARKTLADVIRDAALVKLQMVGLDAVHAHKMPSDLSGGMIKRVALARALIMDGICGACTILLDGEPVRSCLMFGVQAEGREIRTVEGLADGETLHPLQQAFTDNHALQCGYCTPGFLMLATGVLEANPDISDEDLNDALASNLCRCTGYQNIIKAVRQARDEMKAR